PASAKRAATRPGASLSSNRYGLLRHFSNVLTIAMLRAFSAISKPVALCSPRGARVGRGTDFLRVLPSSSPQCLGISFRWTRSSSRAVARQPSLARARTPRISGALGTARRPTPQDRAWWQALSPHRDTFLSDRAATGRRLAAELRELGRRDIPIGRS